MHLPEAFIIRTKNLLGDEWSDFERALNEESPVSIRLNPKKINPDKMSDTSLLSAEPIPWATDGFYLKSRPSFTSDPLFHAGCYYVQEASSMILEHFVRNYFPKSAKVLDLCAAPGGKSTHLSALLPEESLLVANEVIRSRASVLVENLTKWGNPNTIVTCNDPAEIGKSLPGFFDVIVADLPCSGEGMFRKDPAAVTEWSVNNVRLCAERQRRIIADVLPVLKTGGILIYCTCTYNREENEENINRICRDFEVELLEEPRRMMPHLVKGEGFFIAGMRKKTKAEANGERRRLIHLLPLPSPFALYLSSPGDFTFISDNTRRIAVSKIHFQDYLQIKSKLRILSAGVALGEMKGSDFVPDHALAMSNALSDTAFPRWEVDKETALSYLRKEAFQTVPSHLPKGFILVTYKEHPVGFIKNIGTRANNLYPQDRRIRKSLC